MYVPNMCELNTHMLLRELRAKGIAADAVVAPDTFLYRQRGGADVVKCDLMDGVEVRSIVIKALDPALDHTEAP